MTVKVIFAILAAFTAVRAAAYGVYCTKETGILGGIGVFALSLAAIAAGVAVFVFGG